MNPTAMAEESLQNPRHDTTRIQFESTEEEEGASDDFLITPSLLKDWFSILVYRFMNYSLYLLGFCMNLLWHFSLGFLVGYAIFVDLIVLVISLRKLRYESIAFLRLRKKIEILEKILMISFKSLILVYILTNAFLLSFSILFLILHGFLRIFMYIVYRSQSECFALLDFLAILWRIFLLLITLGIFLKFDGFLNWSLKQVLLPFWILFSLEIGLNFAVFLMILSKLLQKYYENIENSELIGLFWVFYQCLYYLFSGFLFMTGMIDYYDNHSQEKLAILLYSLGFFLFFFHLFSFVAEAQILKFFHLVSKVDPNATNESSNLGNSQSISNNQNERGHNAHRKKKKTFTIPKYLVKFSSTYFKKSLNESFNSIRKTINKFPRPQKTHTRSISMNWIFREAQKNPKKAPEPNTDILFTLPSEKGHENKERETARFDDKKTPKVPTNLPSSSNDQQALTTNSSKRGHTRIYSMFVQSGSVGMTASNSETQGQKHEPSVLEKSNANCLICFDKQPDSVFMECGHGGICYECALDVWKTTGECYLCRKEISHVLQLDLKANVGNYMKVLSSTEMDESSMSEKSKA